MNNEFNSNFPPINDDENNNNNNEFYQSRNNFIRSQSAVENNNINMADSFQQAPTFQNDNINVSNSIEENNNIELISFNELNVQTNENMSMNSSVQNEVELNNLVNNGEMNTQVQKDYIIPESSNINPPAPEPVEEQNSPSYETTTTSEEPNNTLSNNDNQDEANKNTTEPIEKKSSVAGTIITILILLVFAAIIGYLFWSNKPKNIFVTSINKMYSDFNTYVKDFKSNRIVELSRNNVIIYNTNIKVDSDVSELDEFADLLKGLTINYILGMDQKNEKMNINFDIKSDENELMNLKLYNESNLLYLLDEKLDKYIIIDNVDPSIINKEKTKDEILYLIEKVKDLFIKSLKEEYFDKEEESLIINNEVVDTKKTTLMINDKRLKEILIFIINGLKSDEHSIEAIITINNSNINKEEILEIFDKILEECKKQDLLLDGEIILELYSKGLFNKVVKYNLMIKYNDNYGKLKDTRISYVLYTEKNKAVKEIMFKKGIIAKAKLLIKSGDDKNTYDLILYDSIGEEISNIIFDIKSKKTELVIDKKFNNKIDVNILIKDISRVENKNDINIGVSIDTDIIVGGELEEIDDSKVVRIDDLTEEEQLTFIMKYFSIFGLLPTEYNPLMEN